MLWWDWVHFCLYEGHNYSNLHCDLFRLCDDVFWWLEFVFGKIKVSRWTKNVLWHYLESGNVLTQVFPAVCVVCIIAMCISTSVTVFGVMIGLDRTWMPDWHTNVLGWSFGLAVIAGFFATFSFIAITVYTLMVKYEQAVNRAVESQPQTKKVPMIPKIWYWPCRVMSNWTYTVVHLYIHESVVDLIACLCHHVCLL